MWRVPSARGHFCRGQGRRSTISGSQMQQPRCRIRRIIPPCRVARRRRPSARSCAEPADPLWRAPYWLLSPLTLEDLRPVAARRPAPARGGFVDAGISFCRRMRAARCRPASGGAPGVSAVHRQLSERTPCLRSPRRRSSNDDELIGKGGGATTPTSRPWSKSSSPGVSSTSAPLRVASRCGLLPGTGARFSDATAGAAAYHHLRLKAEPQLGEYLTRTERAAPMAYSVLGLAEHGPASAFQTPEVNDYGCCDIRLSQDGTPYIIIDVSPNCDDSADGAELRAGRGCSGKSPAGCLRQHRHRLPSAP